MIILYDKSDGLREYEHRKNETEHRIHALRIRTDYVAKKNEIYNVHLKNIYLYLKAFQKMDLKSTRVPLSGILAHITKCNALQSCSEL